jgi:hypothetical protein
LKYMLTWTERPQGSPVEYENAQKRILEVFTQWKAPGNFKIELFVIRVGDWGGYMLLDCDDATAVHKFCSMLPAFVSTLRRTLSKSNVVRIDADRDHGAFGCDAVNVTFQKRFVPNDILWQGRCNDLLMG